MIKGSLPIICEQDRHDTYDYEDSKYENYCSPLPKNQSDYSYQSKKPRRSTLGISNFRIGVDTSPSGDRFIPKRRDHDSNIAMYEINNNDSPPIQLNRDDFKDSFEYEEQKKAFHDKLEYNEILKETFFGYPSPSKETCDTYIEANLFISPQKSNTLKHKTFKKKLLNFNARKNYKENKKRAVKTNPLEIRDLRIHGMASKQAEKVTKIHCEKVLDAPNMVDDFYLNLLDWSEHNVLAIALKNHAYLMDVDSKNIS